MKIFLTGLFLGGLVAIAGAFIGFSQHAQIPPQTQIFGSSSFTPVEGIPYTVAKTILPTDNTITLSTFNTPDGRKLVMSNFGQIGYGTLDPTNISRLESVTFTGITQNGNGTVTLTGVSRGLDFISPYAASTTLSQTHLVGSSFILSNTSAFYGQQFPLLNNPSTIAATWTFSSTTQPQYDGNPASWSSQNSLVNKAYVDSGILNGAATSTFANQGLVWLATQTQIAAGTASSTTGSPLVIPSLFATSTPGSNAGTQIPVTIGGKIAQAFWDLTQPFSWSGLNTFTAGLLDTASSTMTATTTIAASNVLSKAFVLNGIPLQFPSTQCASGQVWINNGSGILSCGTLPSEQYSIASTSRSSIINNVTITSSQLSVPAGVLTASSTVTVSGVAVCLTSGSGGTCTLTLIDTNSNTYCTLTLSPGTSASNFESFNINLFANSSLSSQSGSMSVLLVPNSGAASDQGGGCGASVNWANATNFEVRYLTSNTTGVSGTLSPFTLTVRP